MLIFSKSISNLIINKKNKAGRNNSGKITVRRRGGGHKRMYRRINFNFLSSLYYVLNTEYDPNRNSLIGLVRCCISGNFNYILLNKNVISGSIIRTNNHQVISGGRYFLKDLPANYIISNVSIIPFQGGKFARSSGSFCKILQKDFIKSIVKIKMPSLEERFVSMNCMANVGPILNTFKHLKKLKKAGNSRWLGRRPSVRGVAMNPIDHPHGGGQGKTSGGRPSVTPWGHITIGKKTRSSRRYSNSSIVKKRKQF
jgi:large subunit ribosomal protein L2